MAEDKKQLSDLEARILHLLSNSSGNILDDEVRTADSEMDFYGACFVNRSKVGGEHHVPLCLILRSSNVPGTTKYLCMILV